MAEKLSRLDLVRAVQAHALAHYEDGGWDVVVECYDTTDILRVIGNTTTLAGALRKFAPIISVFADRQADAVNSAF